MAKPLSRSLLLYSFFYFNREKSGSMVDPENDLKNCADRADRGPRPANILRDLHNSLGHTKAESKRPFSKIPQYSLLYKRCFQVLLGVKMAPRGLEANADAKFWRDNKEYYGIFEKGVEHCY